MQLIIFTDLDGTFLDKNYSFSDALPALNLIKKKKIPLIFCTSKTEAETLYWQQKIGISYPFIVENGSAIIFPDNKLRNIILGTNYSLLKQKLEKIEYNTHSKFEYMSNMTVKELVDYTGLSVEQAKMAKTRLYSESFLICRGSPQKVRDHIKKAGLVYTRATLFHHILGDTDKGKAVRVLTGVLRKQYGQIKTISFGDSFNDKPMLKATSKSYLIKNGPFEWNQIILKIIS
ncbi:MAG: HAD-IIB family hydrolase [Nanoarchaeota archaeon]